MHTLVGYEENIDPAGVLVNITAIPDPHVFVSGDDIRVPDVMSHIIGEAFLGNHATLARGQLFSPSLRAIAQPDIEPLVAALVFGSPPEALMHPLNPHPLVPDEALNALLESTPTVVQIHRVFVWLGDGAQQPVTGVIHHLRATTAITLATAVWTNGAITFGTDLPVGRYQIVGMRARGTNLVAARLVFIGSGWRPGVPAVNAVSDLDVMAFRMGRMGSWGEFHTNNPPSIDALGVTDSAQTYIFDIIKVG